MVGEKIVGQIDGQSECGNLFMGGFLIIRTTIIILMLLLGLKAPMSRVITWNLQGCITSVAFCVFSLCFLMGICILKIVLVQFYSLYQGSLSPSLQLGTRSRSVWNWATQTAGEHVSTHNSICMNSGRMYVPFIQMELASPLTCCLQGTIPSPSLLPSPVCKA